MAHLRTLADLRSQLILKQAEVAALLGCALPTIKEYRDADPTFPRPVWLPARRGLQWRTADILAWVERLEHGPPATSTTNTPNA